jgi:O-antigen/teichoic acid export membrane protein
VTRSFLALGAGEVIARLLSFAATVYLARTLGASIYGVVGVATAVLLYFSRAAEAGLDLVGVHEIARDPRRAQTLGSAALTFRLVLAVGLAAVLLVAGLVLPQPDGAVLAAYGLTLLVVGASSRWIHLGLEQPGRVAVARALGEGAMVLLVLVLVRGPGDVGYVPLAQFVAESLGALLLLLWLRRSGIALTVRFDWAEVAPLVKRAWPLLLATFFGLLVYNSDLLFLRAFRGAGAVGYYAAAYTLVGFAINLGLAYRASLLPTLSRLEADARERHALYHTSIAQVFAIVCPAAIGGWVLAPLIIRTIFGDAYAPSAEALQVLVWVIPLSLLRDVPVVALVAHRREDRILRLNAWAAGLNTVLNVVLIPRYGLLGAGLASVGTEAVRMVHAFVYARAEGYALVNVSRVWKPVLAGLVMAATLLVLRPAMLWLAIPAGMLGYAVVLSLLGGIRFRRGALPVLSV